MLQRNPQRSACRSRCAARRCERRPDRGRAQRMYHRVTAPPAAPARVACVGIPKPYLPRPRPGGGGGGGGGGDRSMVTAGRLRAGGWTARTAAGPVRAAAGRSEPRECRPRPTARGRSTRSGILARRGRKEALQSRRNAAAASEPRPEHAGGPAGPRACDAGSRRGRHRAVSVRGQAHRLRAASVHGEARVRGGAARPGPPLSK
jgi:hypothetical protein